MTGAEHKKHAMRLVLLVSLATFALYWPSLLFPRSEVDTYFTIALADDLRGGGAFGWFFSASSPFGQFPSSYPAGAPTLLASFSSLAGIDTLDAVGFLGPLCVLLAALGCVCIADWFGATGAQRYLVAFFVVLSPVVFLHGWQSYSGRTLLFAVFPIVFLGYLHLRRRSEAAGLIVIGIAVVTGLLSHRVALFSLGIIGAVILQMAIAKRLGVVLIRIDIPKKILMTRLFVGFVLVGALLAGFIFQPSRVNFSLFQTGAIFAPAISPLEQAVNFGVTYTGKYGIFFVLMIAGVFVLLLNRGMWRAGDRLSIALVTATVPTLIYPDYSVLLATPMGAALLVALGRYVRGLGTQNRRRILSFAIATGVIATLPLASLMNDRWDSVPVAVVYDFGRLDVATFESVVYAGNFLSNQSIRSSNSHLNSARWLQPSLVAAEGGPFHEDLYDPALEGRIFLKPIDEFAGEFPLVYSTVPPEWRMKANAYARIPYALYFETIAEYETLGPPDILPFVPRLTRVHESAYVVYENSLERAYLVWE